jgi:CspA family cold shock protein
MTGTIKKMISDKGFGFISVEGQEKDLFFHSKSLSGVAFTDLHEGDTVSFDVDESGPKGPAAINVSKA